MRFGLQRRPKRVDRTLSRRLAKEELAFKKRLVQARHDSGLSQTDVAELLGVNKSAISRFERADSNPTLSMIRHYAHAIGALVIHDVEPNWSTDAEADPTDVVTPWLGSGVLQMTAGPWLVVGAGSRLTSPPGVVGPQFGIRVHNFTSAILGAPDADAAPGSQSSAGRVALSSVRSVVG
ncbi:helix-turn-helix domain-containing protein [Nocardia suismassiliense]|uniref:Helix-turn-helix domain-containing protein n=1 Tax=Nocardia suismassiliense TaxID=2077092 RepID=A0ABW6QY13_9NOCA